MFCATASTSSRATRRGSWVVMPTGHLPVLQALQRPFSLPTQPANLQKDLGGKHAVRPEADRLESIGRQIARVAKPAADKERNVPLPPLGHRVQITVAQFAEDRMPRVIHTHLVRRAGPALNAVEEKAADDVVRIADQVVKDRDARRAGRHLDRNGHAELESGVHAQEHLLHGLFDAVQPLMIGRTEQVGFGHAANRLDMRRDLFGGEQAAVARFRALTDLDENRGRVGHHVAASP